MAEAEPLLEARNLVKHYGQVLALDGANFTAYPGEVVALIGDNGAGKSTLVKALSGAIRPDGGDILVGGNVVHLSSPLDARRYGIETVYQDLALAPDLDAAANLHLGREIYRLRALGVLNKPEMRRRAIAAFKELGVELPDVSAPVVTLSGGQRQSVAVARAVAYASKIIFMDEPTAALGVVQRERVLDNIKRVRDRGISVVLISHNMPEVLAVADRVEVLRMGRRVARFKASETNRRPARGRHDGRADHRGRERRARQREGRGMTGDGSVPSDVSEGATSGDSGPESPEVHRSLGVSGPGGMPGRRRAGARNRRPPACSTRGGY